jgi:hypothetical protein
MLSNLGLADSAAAPKVPAVAVPAK